MKTLKLDNFRCFETFEMEFRTGLNLLIGDNSSGKTTVLKALKIALSSFFMGFSDEYTRFIGIDKSDFTVSSHGDMMRLDRPVKINENWNRELNEVLNLNTPLLKLNRKSTLNGVITLLSANGKSQWSNNVMNSVLEKWKSLDGDLQRKEYCGIVIWFLEKKIRQKRK